jgi:hypothetical protein
VKKLIAAALGAATSFGMAGSAFAAPAWCVGLSDKSGGGDLKRLSSQDVTEVIEAHVLAACLPSDQADGQRAQIDASRTAWSTKLAMTEHDWADAVGYLNQGPGARYNDHLNIQSERDGGESAFKRAWSGFDPLDQWAMISRGNDLGGDDLVLDAHYLADALGPRLSELGRAAYVRRCIRGDGRTEAPVAWAMCQADIEQLDFAKLAGELRANQVYDGGDKMRLRIEVYKLRAALPAHAARVKATMGKDPGYAKIFELARAAREEWAGRYKNDSALLDLVAAMDDARATSSRKAFAGCEDKTWAAWKAAVGALPAKAFQGMQDDRDRGRRFDDQAMGPLLSNPSVYLAAVALTTCMAAGANREDRPDVLIRLLASGLKRWPGFRGPRTGTEAAVMTTGITLDDRGAKLEYPEVMRSFGGSGDVSLSIAGGGSGVVASLKPAGKLVSVTFKQQLVKQVQCAERKASNRINQITSSGHLIYDTTCVRNETVVVDKASAPQAVNPRYLAGVKPGMDVSILEDVVVWARATPGSLSPTMVFGVALK